MGNNESKDKNKDKSKNKNKNNRKTSKVEESSSTDAKTTLITTKIEEITITQRTRLHSVSSQSSSPFTRLTESRSTFPTNTRNVAHVRGPIGMTYLQSDFNNPNSSSTINRYQLSPRNNHETFAFQPLQPPRNQGIFASQRQQNATDLKIPPSTINISGSRPELRVNVIKTKQRYDNLNNHVPTYKTSGKKRGLALIINNINFNKKPRLGAEIDEKNLMNLFNGLKISPKIKKNLTADEMKSSLKNYAKHTNFKDYDMCFVTIMSHGTGSMDTMTEIAGIDDNSIKVYDVIQQFSNENCPSLKGKPKIFLFQCCRGDNERKDEYDSKPSRPQKCEDMLLAFATMPGYVALRNIENGSPYIRTITEVFMKHACDTEIQDMLIRVQDLVKQQTNDQQTCSFENLSFKKCYLHPS